MLKLVRGNKSRRLAYPVGFDPRGDEGKSFGRLRWRPGCFLRLNMRNRERERPPGTRYAPETGCGSPRRADSYNATRVVTLARLLARGTGKGAPSRTAAVKASTSQR